MRQRRNRMMECQVCLETFDDAERRPKVLPCGHTYCLRCLRRLPARQCPLDNRAFDGAANTLPDNFTVLQAFNRPEGAAAPRFWCRTCNADASEECLDAEHSVCSAKRVRLEDAGPALQALQRDEAALDGLGAAMQDAERTLDHAEPRGHLRRARADIASTRTLLLEARGAGEAAWRQAKETVVQNELSRSAAQLVADLLDPDLTCSLTVRRGEAGDVAWQGDVRAADDAAVRLLLCRQVCAGGLRQPAVEGQAPAVARAPAPRWEERSNVAEAELTVIRMSQVMRPGCRVARGRDWDQGCTGDGAPPGPGTAKRRDRYTGDWCVQWDRTGAEYWYSMGRGGRYCLRYLAAGAMKPLIEVQEGVLDVQAEFPNDDIQGMAQLLTAGRLAQVRSLVGLPCITYAPWSKMVLDQVAPHLEGLQMVSPLQRHIDAVLAMPQLHSLSIIGVTGDQLAVVGQVASLRRLELHCTFDAPLPVLAGGPARLEWLRCGVYPLAAALALVRANAESLEELQLVAASAEPYGCPDLAAELRRCGLKKLKRMVLLRETAYDSRCTHDRNSCALQLRRIWQELTAAYLGVLVSCSECTNGGQNQ